MIRFVGLAGVARKDSKALHVGRTLRGGEAPRADERPGEREMREARGGRLMSNRCGELKALRTYEIDDRSAGEKGPALHQCG